MSQPTLPKITIDTLMKKIRGEASKLQTTAPFLQTTSSSVPVTESLSHPTKIKTEMMPELNTDDHFNLDFSLLPQLAEQQQTESPFPNHNVYHVNDFCRYHDQHFIKNSFKGLLKRRPNAQELNHYLLLLRQGHRSKKEIVSRIRYSKEGRKRKVTVKGLFLPTAVMLMGKIPLIGSIFQILIIIIRLPALLTQVRQLEALSQVSEPTVEQLAELIQNKLKNTLDTTLQHAFDALQRDFHQAALQQKDLRSELTTKINRAELATKAERSELECKADRSELECKVERSELATKVNRSELEEKVDYLSLNSMLDDKVDSLKAILAGKVSNEALDKKLELRMDITSFYKELSSRVDITSFHKELALRVDYDSLKINLATKVNQTAMDEVLEHINHNKNRLDSYQIKLNDYKTNLLDHQRRLNLLLEEARKRLPEPFSPQQLKTIADEEAHIFDAMYVAFEDKFRGTRKDIQQRQKVYIPTIEKALKATQHSLVIDMGCGRGEWLELLQVHHINAEGVDLNCMMIRECDKRGLKVTEADILDHLRSLKNSSVSAVTGFHIIEHLSFKVLIALFDECLRVLKPGGVIIFETPNPENVLVGACHFYTDPSHHHPLVPETMRFIIEQRGFEKTNIKRLHKYSDFYETISDDEFIKTHFYNEMDYAIIGHKV